MSGNNQRIPNISFKPLQRGETRNWNFATEVYGPNQQVQVLPGCFAIMFTNIGDVPAEVGGMLLYPGVVGTSLGDSRSLGGHLMDLFKGRIQIKFLPSAGTQPLVELVQLFYLEETK